MTKRPRFLVYPVDKHQSCPYFTDKPAGQGEEGTLDVLVDLELGERKYNGEWLEIERVK